MSPVKTRWREDPARVSPMLASLEEPPLVRPGYVYEPKYDGIRALVDLRPAAPRTGPPRIAIYSRNGREKQAQFPEIVDALASLRAEAAIALGPPRAGDGLDKPLLVVRTRPNEGAGKPRTLRIGKGDAYRDNAIFYARADGIDATYVIAQSRISPILDALAP